MAFKERIFFQPYVSGPKARLLPGPAVPCRNADEAHRRAEKAMEGGRILGAHIIRTFDDEATGEYGVPEYLFQFGRVPNVADGEV